MTGTHPIRKRYADVPEGQIHVHERAGIAPPIVFLHQTASSAGSFDDVLAAMPLPNRLIAIDTPGFGGSFDPLGTPDMGDYARWILATCDALDTGPFHLVGHHTGASLAIEIARQEPAQVLSLALVGPVFMTDAERGAFEDAYREPFAPRRDGAHLLKNWNYAAMFNPDCPVELVHREVVAMLRAWRGRAQAYRAVARHDTAVRADGVEQPVLLLTSPDDYFHATFDRAREVFPDARTGTVGGGNFQPSADPEGVARAIADFIRAG